MEFGQEKEALSFTYAIQYNCPLIPFGISLKCLPNDADDDDDATFQFQSDLFRRGEGQIPRCLSIAGAD